MAKILIVVVEIIIFFSIVVNCHSQLQRNKSGSNSAEKEIIDYRNEMRNLVRSMSSYAKSIDNDFIVITQNGNELLQPVKAGNKNNVKLYMASIDAVAQESFLYGYSGFNKPTPGNITAEWQQYLDLAVRHNLQVLVSDYCKRKTYVDDSYQKNHANQYVSFAAGSRLLDVLPDYPEHPFQSEKSQKHVKNILQIKNFCYLISPSGKKFNDFNSFVTAMQNTDYDLLITDLFFDGSSGTLLSADDVKELAKKQNGGTRLVIAYLSIGEAEDYRFYWQSTWKNNPPVFLAEENPEWEGNYKVRYWYSSWQKIIFGNENSYLYMILDAGFDGIYLDIIDAFEYFEENE